MANQLPVVAPGFRGKLVLSKRVFYALKAETRARLLSIMMPVRKKPQPSSTLNSVLKFVFAAIVSVILGYLFSKLFGDIALAGIVPLPLAKLFTSKALKGGYEDVVVIDAPGLFGDNHQTIHIDATTRPSGGLRGVKILDAALAQNKEVWAEMWAQEHRKVGASKLTADTLLGNGYVRAWTPSMAVKAVELPGADTLSEEQTETLNQVVSRWCEQERGLVIRGPQSAVFLQVYEGKCTTPLARVVDQLATGTTDIQQYVLSLLQATVAHPIADLNGLPEEAYVPLNNEQAMASLGRAPSMFVIYNNELPLGDVDGVPVYLADAGSDGTYNAAGFEANEIVPGATLGGDINVDGETMSCNAPTAELGDLRGQCRGFHLGNLTEATTDADKIPLPGMILKGMRETQLLGAVKKGEETDCGHDLVNLTVPRMQSWDSRIRGVKVEAIDLDLVKGLGKEHPVYLWAKANVKPGKAVVVSEEVYLWLIRITKEGNQLATSFQYTARWQSSQDVDEKRVHGILTKKLFEASPEVKAIVQGIHRGCASMLGVQCTQAGLDAIPVRAFVESVDKLIARMASSASTRTMRMGKERQNINCFIKWLVAGDGLLKYTDADKRKLELQWRLDWYQGEYNLESAPENMKQALKAARAAEEQVEGFDPCKWKFKSEGIQVECDIAWEKAKYAILNPMFREVAQARVPTTTDRNPTTALAMSKRAWLLLAEAVRSGQTHFLGTDNIRYDVDALLGKIVKYNNDAVKTKEFKEELLVADLGEAKQQLLSLAYSIEFANFTGTFMCHPAESRDRQADCDGDDTGCDPSLFWVQINRDIEASADMKENLVFEFPKSQQRQWADSEFDQKFHQLDGQIRKETHVKAKKLKDMLPTHEWAIYERFKDLNKVLLAALQGATGLASNQEVDIYIRIKWKIVDVDGKKRKVPATAEDEKLYELWILYVLFIQLMIDNQKRSYALPYFDTESWRVLVAAIRKAGGKGLKNLNGLGLPMATEASMLLKKKFLAPNGTFNPELVYKFAAEVMGVPSTVDYKASSKDGSIRKTPEEVYDAMMTQDFDRSNRVWQTVVAACKPQSGWRHQFKGPLGYMAGYTAKIASAFKAKKANPEGMNPLFFTAVETLAKQVPAAMREVALANLGQGGDMEDLSKMSALRRGRIFLKSLGFSDEGVRGLAENKKAESTFVPKVDFSVPTIAIAMALGARNRPVDAYEILVSYIVAESELSQEIKQALVWGEDRRKTMLRRATRTHQGASVLSNNVDGAPKICSDSTSPAVLRREWALLAEACRHVLTHFSQAFVEQSIGASENCHDRDEVIDNAMLIASPLVRLYRTAELYSRRQALVPPHVSKADLQFHGQFSGTIAPSKTRLDANARAPRNDKLGWLKTVAASQDMRYSAWKEVARRRPVTPEGDLVSMRKLFLDLQAGVPDLLILSRTVFGGAGWASKLLLSAVDFTSRSSQWKAKNVLNATCSSIIAGPDTRGSHEAEFFEEVEEEVAQPRNRDEWHAALKDGFEKGGAVFTQGIPLNLRDAFTRLFGGVTPIPAGFKIVVNKGTDFAVSHGGPDAVNKLYSDALALKISRRYYHGTQAREEALKSFFQAREEFFTAAEEDGMAYYDAEADAWIADDLDPKALRPLMAISLWKMTKVGEQWVPSGKEPTVLDFMRFKARVANVEALVEAYSKLGL